METPKDLFGRAWQILQDRQDWENKQRRYYVMRHDGLRRRNKPFPSAADLHLALVDEAISKLKPFTLAQVTSAPRLASFVAMRQQLQETSDSSADFFSFELRERSNFFKILESMVDTMWLRGRGIIKAYVDPFDDYKIIHENVDPLYLLMADTANDFDDADEWVHVRQISVQKFKRDRRYFNRFNTEENESDTNYKISLMRGGKDALNRLKTQRGRDFDEIQIDKEYREGFTHSASADTIILWEHYVRTMGGIMVYTYCPVAMDVEVRKPFGVPYKVRGKVTAPFFSFVAEIKDEGWYSPRGVAEKIADKEIYACKLWNAKADAITYFNTPMFTSDTPIQNPSNYRQVPGEYIPNNIKPVQFGQPAFSFDSEINFARGEAEIAAQMPDLGIEKANQGRSEKRTAREISVAASLSQVGQNHFGYIFKDCLSKLLRFDWALCLQYKRNNLTYFVAEDLKTLPEQALHDEYLITPAGNLDDWDRGQKMQRAVQRFQALRGAPNVNQDELVKDILSADDARLVKRLLIPSQQKAASEAEDENYQITSMIVTHFPAPVKPEEDHITRIKTIVQFLQAQGAKNKTVDPLAKQRIQEHLVQHLQILKQLQPVAYKQIVMELKQLEQQPMQQQGMPQQQMQGQSQAQLTPPQSPPQSEMRML